MRYTEEEEEEEEEEINVKGNLCREDLFFFSFIILSTFSCNYWLMYYKVSSPSFVI